MNTEKLENTQEKIDLLKEKILNSENPAQIPGEPSVTKAKLITNLRQYFEDLGYETLSVASSWGKANELAKISGTPEALALEAVSLGLEEAQKTGTQYFNEQTFLLINSDNLKETDVIKLMEDVKNEPVKFIFVGTNEVSFPSETIKSKKVGM